MDGESQGPLLEKKQEAKGKEAKGKMLSTYTQYTHSWTTSIKTMNCLMHVFPER